MKKIIVITASLTFLAASTAVILLSTASKSTASQPDAGHASEPWSFKEGRGLTLSEVARQATAISLAPVESASILPERSGIGGCRLRVNHSLIRVIAELREGCT